MEPIFETTKFRWFDIMQPGREDFIELQQQFGFHELSLEDCVTRMQRAKIDQFDDHLFVVIQYPLFDHLKRRINPGQMGIFLGKDYVVTVRNDESKVINEMQDVLKIPDSNLAQEIIDPPQLFYRLMDRVVDKYFPMVDKISYNLERVERLIFEHPSYEWVKEISIIRRNILNLRKIIAPKRRLIASFEHDHHKIFPEKLDIFFDDILDHIEKIWSQIDANKELLEGLSITNESLITFRTNEVIRILTVFSVVLLPLTLISGIWGMNVSVPGQNNPAAFMTIIFSMITIGSSMLLFFWWKKWL